MWCLFSKDDTYNVGETDLLTIRKWFQWYTDMQESICISQDAYFAWCWSPARFLPDAYIIFGFSLVSQRIFIWVGDLSDHHVWVVITILVVSHRSSYWLLFSSLILQLLKYFTEMKIYENLWKFCWHFRKYFYVSAGNTTCFTVHWSLENFPVISR